VIFYHQRHSHENEECKDAQPQDAHSNVKQEVTVLFDQGVQMKIELPYERHPDSHLVELLVASLVPILQPLILLLKERHHSDRIIIAS
jgi:hypothetical protein